MTVDSPGASFAETAIAPAESEESREESLSVPPDANCL
jgi:hypothetical protein